MEIAVGSRNPVKLEAVRLAFERTFPGEAVEVVGHEVDPGVPEQPHGEAETREGALTRARGAARRAPGADYHVGIEGGVAPPHPDDSGGAEGSVALHAFARVVVLRGDRIGESATGRFRLPEPVAALVWEGVELGEADDRVFGREGSKSGKGAVGLLTGGSVTRTELYAQAVCLALCRFVHPELYGDDRPARGSPGRR